MSHRRLHHGHVKALQSLLAPSNRIQSRNCLDKNMPVTPNGGRLPVTHCPHRSHATLNPNVLEETSLYLGHVARKLKTLLPRACSLADSPRSQPDIHRTKVTLTRFAKRSAQDFAMHVPSLTIVTHTPSEQRRQGRRDRSLHVMFVCDTHLYGLFSTWQKSSVMKNNGG